MAAVMSEPDAFGYRDDSRIITTPTSSQVSEAKRSDTLEPIVVLYLRLAPDAEQFGIPLTPDEAEALAAQLTHFAKRAREKHWE